MTGPGVPTLDGPHCYYINPSQDPDEHGGYVPSVVEDGKPGHWPLLGRGECALPWVWGQTLAEAQAICDSENEKLGVSQREAARMVLRSMAAGDGSHWPRQPARRS